MSNTRQGASGITKEPTVKVCTRCGGTDAVGPLPRKYACRTCGQRGLCYACDTSHGTWCGQGAREARVTR